MSLTNAPDPEVRAARGASRTWTTSCTRSCSTRCWKRKQMVVTGAQGSTIFDADGTDLSRRHGRACGASTSAMAAPSSPRSPPSRCSRSPTSRTPAMNLPAAELAREDQRADGRRLPHLFRQLGVRGERGRLQDRPAIREARISRANSASRRSAATTPITAPRWPRWTPAAWATARRKFEPYSGDFVHVAGADLLSLPVRPELPELRPGLRQEHRDHDPRRGAGDCGRSASSSRS